MKKLIVCALCLSMVVAAGCSHPKVEKQSTPAATQPAQKLKTGGNETNVPSPATEQPSARAAQPSAPTAQPAGKTAPSENAAPAAVNAKPGSITGNVVINDLDNRKGNLFVFILDNKKMPQPVVVSSSFLSANKIAAGKTQFSLGNVPPGNWSVLAVWDSSPPFCKMTDKYCRASTKDGIGMATQLVKVAPGETSLSPDINISF